MDLQEIAQLLGNFGEFIGSIAVVATLIYLTGQLKQNTRALQSSAYQTYNERTDSYWDFEAQHAAELAGIYESANDFEALSSEQRIILNASMMKSFNLLEGMFLQHLAGNLRDREFLAKAEGFKTAYQDTLVRDAWQRLGSTMAFTREFRTFMDAEILNTPSLNPSSYYATFRK